ncbi:MAG: GMP synthase [Saprospirales bacterium]|nr:GMP synthase [Saprospirales bacterium]MBK8922500.1 GMP synthase [Saprospirales bacterium]
MLRAALIDMYNGESNRGIPMLRSMLSRYANVLRFDHFDVRAKNEVPDLSYDIYLFSGGPGDPLLNDGPWFERFFNLIENLWRHNCRTAEDRQKKHCFFICHSFQMACHHFGLGAVQLRYKMSFGTYPVHRTHWGKVEPFFEGLPDPFYIADFRRYQVVKPTPERFEQMGAHILCLEKLRPHLHYERALMAVRFSPEMIGTQFHPEADPAGLLSYFMEPERKKSIVDEHGAARYDRMIRDLANPMKIQRTYDTVIPNFIENAVEQLSLMPA